MKRYTRTLGSILVATMLAACSGGANTSSLTPPANPAHRFAWTGKTGHLHIHVKFPSSKERKRINHAIARAAAKNGKRPNFLPLSVTSVSFSLISVNGQSVSPPASNPFGVTISTSDTSVCNAFGEGYACNVTVPAPAALDTYTIVASDGTPTTLSESAVTLSVLPAPNVTAGNFTLNPVASSLKWFAGTCNGGGGYTESGGTWSCTVSGFDNGSDTPTLNTGTNTYSCASSGCYDPILNSEGVALYDTAILNVLDPDGDIIVAAAAGSISGSPNVPVYVDGSGNALQVGVSCSDADLQWLQSSPPDGSPPLTAATLQAQYLSEYPQPDLANGSIGGSGGTMQFVGPGISYYPLFTSPANGFDGTLNGGTDFNGNTETIYGNNGQYINYDGGGNNDGITYTLGSTQSCAATLGNGIDGTISSATYYAGLAQGSLTWGVNLAHRRHPAGRTR
ncbi:MAG: hypothetical protein JOY98_06625 [Candidatus Eremiobacteraeota bacterium]|nr:hypothetical protein [Candidatus Eremiobacteraeota bacterium]